MFLWKRTKAFEIRKSIRVQGKDLCAHALVGLSSSIPFAVFKCHEILASTVLHGSSFSWKDGNPVLFFCLLMTLKAI